MTTQTHPTTPGPRDAVRDPLAALRAMCKAIDEGGDYEISFAADAALEDARRTLDAYAAGLAREADVEEAKVRIALSAEIARLRRANAALTQGLTNAGRRFGSFSKHAADSGWPATAEEFSKFEAEAWAIVYAEGATP